MEKILTTIVLLLGLGALQTEAQIWTPRSDYPSAKGGDGSAVFTIGDKIYIAGGFDSKEFYAYDVTTDTWTKKNNIPGVVDSRCFSTGFTVNGKGYIGLGLDIKLSNFAATCKKDLWEYNPATDTWTAKAPYPGKGCDGHFCFIINNIVYVGGGELIHGPSQRDMFAFDPVLNKWTARAAYPDMAGITSPFAFGINNMGYVSCGMQTDGNSVSEVKKTYAYNPSTDTWSPKKDFAGDARQAGVSFVVNGRVYCGWGFDDPDDYFNDFYTYNYTSDSWTESFSGPSEGRGFASAVVTGTGMIYMGIGWQNGDLFYDWWKLSMNSATDNFSKRDVANIYPNPFSDMITISGLANDVSYRIYTLTGNLVEEGKTVHASINTEHIIPGMYLLEVTHDGQSQKRVMVKQP